MNKTLNYNEMQAAISAGTLMINTSESTGESSANVVAAADSSDMSLPKTAGFECVGYAGGLIRQAWAYWPVVVDVSGVSAQYPMPALADHTNKCASVVGQHNIVELPGEKMITSKGILYPKDDVLSAKIYKYAKRGYEWQASILGPIRQIIEVKADESVEVNGQMFNGPLYVVSKMTLREITIVPVGADVNTSFKLT